MSGEADSGSSGAILAGQLAEAPTTNDDTDCDQERVSASNTSYDSNDGATVVKCERCDQFETHSRSLLLVHTAQCGTAAGQPDGEQESDAGMLQQQQQSASQTNSDTNKQHHRKLFECDVCNMKFSNGANMRRHKMRHTGVKPYECRVCQKRFFRKDHLAEHFTTHTKTLPYHCPICNRGFQRQIAMRAHFQNEHVGQHDLVKTCPLCSYRAGTMKSLRVHFFNRHGIDLDNPGPNAPSSLLMALDPTNASQYLPSMAAVAAAAAAAASGPAYSDSGDSQRSVENATPPMHFLTPHVEISMADNETFKTDPTPTHSTTGLDIHPCPSGGGRLNGGSPSSPHSADSNSNAPSSSQSAMMNNVVQNCRNMLMNDGQITPSISLIPIKQEPASMDDYSDNKEPQHRPTDQPQTSPSANVSNSTESAASSSSSLQSLIKVSPLKSLLREDLKRRICARANSRNNLRSSNNNNNNNSPNSNNNLSNNSMSITAEQMQSGGGGGGAVATTSNGTITSTGPETETMASMRNKKALLCLYCGIDFPDQTLYFLHKGCHSDSNPWKCNICGEQCNNVYEFNSHLLSKSHQ